jgi:hypothetical protein
MDEEKVGSEESKDVPPYFNDNMANVMVICMVKYPEG